nr:hypothetical protein [uncultured Sphingomonas sp.]
MLIQIEDRGSKKDAQRRLAAILAKQLKRVGPRRIGFPSGVREEVVHSAGVGSLWSTFGSAEDSPVARTWNAFGVFHSRSAALNITVEINIPTKSNSRSVAGFIARDPLTGSEYLMHDGSIGGGKKGVGRDAYLAWSKSPLEKVATTSGEREGILVCDVDAIDAPDRIWRFVQSVRRFKDAVAGGLLETAGFKQELSEFESYKREFSGRKIGRRGAKIDYLSYHGDVVEALCLERTARALPGEGVFNTKLIDLYVRRAGAITEVFEVKSQCERQSIYTAIGQLLTHAPGPDTDRFLILPHGPLADDLVAAIKTNRISVRRYAITGRKRIVTLE